MQSFERQRKALKIFGISKIKYMVLILLFTMIFINQSLIPTQIDKYEIFLTWQVSFQSAGEFPGAPGHSLLGRYSGPLTPACWACFVV